MNLVVPPCSNREYPEQGLFYLEGEIAWEKCKDYRFIVSGYQKYQSSAAVQRALFKNGTFLEALVAGLKMLRNLSHVTIRDRWFFRQIFDDRDPKRLLPRRAVGSPLARTWSIFYTWPQRWTFGPHDCIQDSTLLRRGINGAYHYRTITDALLRSQKTIQTLEVGEYLFHSGIPPFLFDTTRAQSLNFIGLDTAAFSGLQVLKLRIAAYGDERTPDIFPNMDGLRLLLGSLHRLNELDLILPGDGDKPDFYTFSQVFPQDYHWDHLTSLSLRSFSSSAADLLTLIICRMRRLSHLRLDMIGLLSDTWEGVIECMMRSMHLSSIDVVPYTQFWHRYGTEFFKDGIDFGPLDIMEYVLLGGRHPCLPSDKPDSAANKYITEELEPFVHISPYQVPIHPFRSKRKEIQLIHPTPKGPRFGITHLINASK